MALAAGPLAAPTYTAPTYTSPSSFAAPTYVAQPYAASVPAFAAQNALGTPPVAPALPYATPYMNPSTPNFDAFLQPHFGQGLGWNPAPPTGVYSYGHSPSFVPRQATHGLAWKEWSAARFGASNTKARKLAYTLATALMRSDGISEIEGQWLADAMQREPGFTQQDVNDALSAGPNPNFWNPYADLHAQLNSAWPQAHPRSIKLMALYIALSASGQDGFSNRAGYRAHTMGKQLGLTRREITYVYDTFKQEANLFARFRKITNVPTYGFY
eukprot:TRINITY_DN202_c0_g1_i1.p1 TRINITY_DN202_c0_g1~~TRINITY_DN202_c0_g1_i1.p1  ORF type:complete len:290 (+),score=53.14 TRINITY_DN202_c0_g1_i1:59-871(+)